MHQVPSHRQWEAMRCSSATRHAQVLRALRHLDLADPLGRHDVGQLARHRRDVVGLRRDRRVLHVGQRLGQLLVAAVQVADHRVDADDRFAFERQHRPEHAMRGRVLRAHVHGQPLAARVVEFADDSRGPVGDDGL